MRDASALAHALRWNANQSLHRSHFSASFYDLLHEAADMLDDYARRQAPADGVSRHQEWPDYPERRCGRVDVRPRG
jgi:hypothetical protein